MLKYEQKPIEALTPYARNSRTHDETQIAKIARSIEEFGFLNPVIIDGSGGIIAGHGRVLAAEFLGMETVPTLEANHLTEDQRNAYVIADNRLAELSGWDDAILKTEFENLRMSDFDLSLTGFDIGEIAALTLGEDANDNYSRKIESPIYEPKGKKPRISTLVDLTTQRSLMDQINASKVTKGEKAFLLSAAARHAVFDYQQIAEYYAHASPEMQSLMEDSALVIIDFNKAIEKGYVKLTKKIARLYASDYANLDQSEPDAEA